jgi:uncharacterized protein YciI
VRRGRRVIPGAGRTARGVAVGTLFATVCVELGDVILGPPGALPADLEHVGGQIRTHIPAHKEWLAQHEADFLIAGPFLDESFTYSGTGLLVIRAGSIAEATKIAESDPMHSSGARTLRIVPGRSTRGP